MSVTMATVEEQPEKYSSAEEIADEANSIFRRIKSELAQLFETFNKPDITITTKERENILEKAVEDLLGRVIEDHRNFANHFPVVLRMMTHKQFYNRKLFIDYLKWYATDRNNHGCNGDAFLRWQAEYMTRVNMHTLRKNGNHPTQADHRKMFDEIMISLREDEEAHKKMQRDAAERARKWDQNQEEGARERLKIIAAEIANR